MSETNIVKIIGITGSADCLIMSQKDKEPYFENV